MMRLHVFACSAALLLATSSFLLHAQFQEPTNEELRRARNRREIRIPYEHGQFKVTDIKGRTIHADGTIIPFNTKRKGAFTLSPDGALTGSIDTSHSGPEGGDLRSFLKYSDEKQRREYWVPASSSIRSSLSSHPNSTSLWNSTTS